ncbi:hypothetical protein [Hugenholtzia roseola]|nr:hypothetical protein [Hugenholtzia roseola]
MIGSTIKCEFEGKKCDKRTYSYPKEDERDAKDRQQVGFIAS